MQTAQSADPSVVQFAIPAGFCKFDVSNLQNRHLSIFWECGALVTNGKAVQKITLVNVIHKSRVMSAVSDVRQNTQKRGVDFYLCNLHKDFGKNLV